MDTDEHGFSTSKRNLPNYPIDETGNVEKFFIISAYPRFSVVLYSLRFLYYLILKKPRVTLGKARVTPRNRDLRFVTGPKARKHRSLRFLLFKIFPVFRMCAPWAKGPETIEHRSFDAHVLQRCRTYGASTLGSCVTKMPHLRRFNAWFMKGQHALCIYKLSELCCLRFLLFKIFPVFQMGAPWAKGPQQASPGRRPGSGQEQAWSPERAAQKRCRAPSGLIHLQTPNPERCSGLACQRTFGPGTFVPRT